MQSRSTGAQAVDAQHVDELSAVVQQRHDGVTPRRIHHAREHAAVPHHHAQPEDDLIRGQEALLQRVLRPAVVRQRPGVRREAAEQDLRTGAGRGRLLQPARGPVHIDGIRLRAGVQRSVNHRVHPLRREDARQRVAQPRGENAVEAGCRRSMPRRTQHPHARCRQGGGKMPGDEPVGAGDEYSCHILPSVCPRATASATRMALHIMPNDMFLAGRLVKQAESAT